jgi:hypothetical protein
MQLYQLFYIDISARGGGWGWGDKTGTEMLSGVFGQTKGKEVGYREMALT